jgi:hypothetical protein
MPNRFTDAQIDHIFRRRYRDGRSKPAPLRGKIQIPQRARKKKREGLKNPPLRSKIDDRAVRLDAEGAAAAAGAFYVWIVEFEAGAFDGFDVVDLDSV